MNELVSAQISPWYTILAAIGLLALTFVFIPGVLLHLAVLLYPKGHDRRKEFTAELYAVPYLKRPFWVTSTLVRCLFEGLPDRLRPLRSRRFSFPRAGTEALPTSDLREIVHIQAVESAKVRALPRCQQDSYRDWFRKVEANRRELERREGGSAP